MITKLYHSPDSFNADTKVLAYDLGGTKVDVGVVDAYGKVLDKNRFRAPIDEGPDAVINLMAKEGQKFIAKHRQIRAIGIASAGPLDPASGRLLDPTNMPGWGEVPIAAILSKRLDLPARLENDAASAALAEHWVGQGKGVDDLLVLTLGTGLGFAAIIGSELHRAGRGLHSEGGHLIIDLQDRELLCGCGNFGCAEAFVSGKNFSQRVSKVLGRKINGRELIELAGQDDARVLEMFGNYGHWLATSIHNYCVLFAPLKIVFTGSFARAFSLFKKPTLQHLERLLQRKRLGVDLMPELLESRIKDDAGIIGAARVAHSVIH